MRLVKDPIDPKLLNDVYEVSCSCKLFYIGETRCSFHTRLKEHGADIRNERIHSLVLAENCSKTKHHIFLEDTKILARESHYFKIKIRESLEIIKHPNNLNKDGGLEISTNWIPSILNRRLR